LVADEGVELQVVLAPREAGHEIWYVAEQAPGITDAEVLAAAVGRDVPLLTCDKDFGDLVYLRKEAMTGVVLLRLAGLLSEEKAALVRDFVKRRGSELHGAFTVVTPRRIRLRRHGGA